MLILLSVNEFYISIIKVYYILILVYQCAKNDDICRYIDYPYDNLGILNILIQYA